MRTFGGLRSAGDNQAGGPARRVTNHNLCDGGGPVMAGHGDADLHGGPRVGFVTPALAFSMLDSLAGRL